LSALENRGLASHLVGRAVLEAAVRVLAPRAIVVMPLKGIWLQQFVYGDPSERRITDVDVLVPEDQYRPALVALREAGWQVCSSNSTEAALRAASFPLPLDLHRSLFTRGAFRMPARALFERGQVDGEAFGVRVTLPDPLDVLAHLVGHFVKSRGGRDSELRALRDFPALLERYGFGPQIVATHLERCGMARASRYALQCVPEDLDPKGLCDAVLAALGSDPIGSVCAEAMLALRRRASAGTPAAMLPGFVLEGSLLRGLRSAALRAVDRVRSE
jgi:hypothetical protein